MRVLLVVNPNSRRGEILGDQIHVDLARYGIEVATRQIAAANGVDAIVAAGGDGTIVHVIPYALRHGVPLGIIPLGTFNELARTLGVPLDIDGACATIAAGFTRAIDVARVNGVHYINEASIGISSRLTRLQGSREKKRFGLWAIAATAVQAFWHSRPIRVDVVHDGERDRFRTVQLTVANSHRFGGLFSVADAAIDDGWLDVYAVEINSLFEALSVARAVASGKRESVPGLRTYRSTAFGIVTRRRHHITADGEPAGKTPARFDLMPKALRVFVPDTAA